MQRAWFVLVAGCTASDVSARESSVIGPAHPAALGELPATGALTSNNFGFPSLTCTGTLIAPSVVLTAAHCVDHPEIPGFTFERYVHTAPTASIHAVTSTMTHPGWTPNVPLGQLAQANDVGLVFLAQPITDLTPALIARPSDGAAIAVDLPVTLAGYGYADGGDGQPGFEYKRIGTSHITMVGDYEVAIARAGEAGACNGDSGGPVYAQLGGEQRIAATVSRGLELMDCTGGGVFTRVDRYVEWIESQVALPCGSGTSPACPGSDDAGVDDAGSDETGSNDAGVDANDDTGSPAMGEDGGGCGCRSTGPSAGWLMLIVALALGRRRTR